MTRSRHAGDVRLEHEIEALANRRPDEGYEEACGRLLHLLRRHVRMEVGWTSEFVGTNQVFRLVDAEAGRTAPQVGASTPLNDAYCAKVLNGTMPALIPNSRDEPTTVWLDITFQLHIASYLGVPLHGPDHIPNGMLCLVSSVESPHLDEHALATARLVAEVIDDLHHRALGEAAARRDRAALHAQLVAMCAGAGRRAVLQPIVDLATGVAVAAEGLTRFTDTARTTAGWFAAAHSIGLGHDLELAAAAAALELLSCQDAPDRLTVNLSPEVALSGLADLLADVDVSRVVLELTEHAPVRDYDSLVRALAPYRERGMGLAVDDAGAGYASMSHVLRLRPDLVKVDMSLVRDVDSDPIRQALIGALQRFSAAVGAVLVAEGVETEGELEALVDLGVGFGQGHLLGRPGPQPVWHGLPHRLTAPPGRRRAGAGGGRHL